jgi:hypothetical protein
MRCGFVVCLFFSFEALARSGGLAAGGCDNCHSSGGGAHTVTIDAPTLQVGGTGVVTVTVRGPGAIAGLHFTASRGTLTSMSGEGTKLLNGEIVHSAPKSLSNGQATFRIQFAAPASAAGVTFAAYTVNGNRNGGSSGDSANSATRAIAIGCTAVTYYRDFDGDGVGAQGSGTTVDCTRPTGYGDRDGDCDDNDALVAPGLAERCNARDDNCNGQSDEGLSSATTWPDSDGDGFGAVSGVTATGCSSSGRAANNRDCDDSKREVNPSAAEVCNSRDDNCDGRIDEGVRARCGVGWCAQLGPTCDPAMCRPGQPTTERCNALDDDCDGTTDEDVVCPSGQACIRGQCIVTEVDDGGLPTDSTDGGPAAVVDAGSSAVDGGPGTMPPGVTDGGTPPRAPPGSTCSSTGAVWALGVLLVSRRRARPRAKSMR